VRRQAIPARLHAKLLPAFLAACSLAGIAGDPGPLSAVVGTAGNGVVVESVTAGGDAHRCGLEAGDRICEAGPEAGPHLPVRDPFHLECIEAALGQGGPVALRGYRGSQPRMWILTAPPWRFAARPGFESGGLSWVSRAGAPGEAADSKREVAPWIEAGEKLESEGHLVEAAWAFSKSSEYHARAKNLKESLALLRRAHGLAERSRSLEARFLLCDRLGAVLKDRGELEEAASLGEREALLALEGWGPESLAYAQALARLGAAAWARRDLDAGRRYHTEALGIRERLAPGGLPVAESLTGLGQVAFSGARLEEAGRYFASALSLQEALAPESIETAKSLSNLGVVARNLGDLEEAEGYAQRALDLQTRLSPGSLAVANSLTTLGLIAHERGDLERADLCHRQALEIREAKAPGGSAVAGSLNNLAGVAESRGDLDQAISWYLRAAALMEKIAPGSLDLAACTSNLGNALCARGDLKGAREAYEKTLAIEGKIAPDSIVWVGNFVNFGELARKSRDLAGAEKQLKEAVALYDRVAPGTLNQADALYFLSLVYRDKGDRKSRERCLNRALEIAAEIAPGSLREAECLRDLGGICATKGQFREALAYSRRAMDSLESQTERLGGTFESRCAFREATYGTYREALEVLLSLGREEEAFTTLERSRSRVLLAMLSERDLDLRAEVPAEVVQTRRRLLKEEEGLMEDLAGQGASADAGKREKTRLRLAEVRSRLSSLRAEIRRASERYASQGDPDPMTLREVRASLPRDTVLLEYSVGKSRTVLFALSGGTGEFRAFRIPIGGEDLRRRVEALRDAVRRFKGARGGGPLAAQCSSLYSLLLGPAEGTAARGTRLVIVPDGPLYGLPFGALRRASGEHLAAWKPLRIAPSATLALAPSRGGESRGGSSMAAFGDPSPPPSARDPAPGALPSARAEVKSLQAVFGNGARVFLGADATKRRVFEEATRSDYLHFACHGTFDPAFPLSSGLLLAPPPGKGSENLLQAWEIFERLRTRAALVTLSSCETGLGREYEGEGILGLVQAFRFAGARSVMASLWKVGDECTAAFMERFYGYLKAGLPKDEALQKVQTEFIRPSPKAAAKGVSPVPPYASAPYFWSAFQLYGE
jgi:CHAT domain-containing protein/tetratricopeptide (TPR) repeat protein